MYALSMLDTDDRLSMAEGMSTLSWVGQEVDPARGQLGLDQVFQTPRRLYHRWRSHRCRMARYVPGAQT